ncbi:MAG: glycosyltransferase family 39 protein [Anaerolineae bacterium]|nr:glycosyltransferase family 39 protein [Anaerolineae bacterium]
MSARGERIALAAILAAFGLLGAIYSVVVPPFEASDELWHYPMVWHIANYGTLPVQDPANIGPWRQEGSQPPLYYALAAAATFWIDTSDMTTIRHLNPHADSGVATADGNVNLVVHHPVREAFPWQGTVLAVHVIRFLSVAMGAAAVYLTFLVARQVLPGQPWLALSAAAVHAFTPMFVFISAAVNNDNLVVPLSSLALLLLLRRLQSDGETARQSTLRYLALGVVLGLAVLTKTSSLALTVLTAGVVVVQALRRRSWAEFLRGALATALPLLAIAGWWFLRNWRLYGDLTGFNRFFLILGTRAVPADLAQLWRERFSFLAGYWGNFGGLNVPMAPWVYGLLDALLVPAALGLLLRLLTRRRGAGELWPAGLGLVSLWALGVLIPWFWWARLTWSSQGRLVFPAIAAWSLLLVLGLSAWLPRRWRVLCGLFPLFLFVLSAVAPFAWIAPAYALPAPLDAARGAAIPRPVDVRFGGLMRLLGYGLGAETARPGDAVEVTLYWEALAASERDTTVFVHLVGEGELLVAQRDTFPGLGLLSTTWLEPGFCWADRYVLTVPPTAFAPDVAQLAVGLYDYSTAARLPATAPDGTVLGDHVRLGEVAIQPLAGEVPNPIAVDFDGQMALVGYDLDRRLLYAGETAMLTLYWRGTRAMAANYTVSAQLVDEMQHKAAQHDGWPLEGNAPTALWEPGVLIVDSIPLAVDAAAPPGVYDLRLAVYELREGEIIHLPVVSAGGGMLADHVLLTRVRVVP